MTKNTKFVPALKHEWSGLSDVVNAISNASPFEMIEVELEWYEIIRVQVNKFFQPFWLCLFAVVFGFIDSIKSAYEDVGEI